MLINIMINYKCNDFVLYIKNNPKKVIEIIKIIKKSRDIKLY